MRTKSFSVKKLLSLVIAIAMMATMVLPASALSPLYADGDAVATVIKGDGADLIKQIVITFNTEITFNSADFIDTNVAVDNSHTLGASTAAIDTTDAKKLVITLADDADIEVGDKITFANDIITDGTEVFNDSVEVVGSLTPATVVLNAPAGVTATVDGGVTEFGVGTYTYSAYGSGFEDATNVEFDIEASDLGTEKTINVAMTEVEAINFTATAVATDVEATYGKADKIVIVFEEAIEADASAILAALSIKDNISGATFDSTKTILTLTVDQNATTPLNNGAKITYTKNPTNKTVSGKVMDTIADVEIKGNLVGAEDQITATAMTATIVNASDEPGVSAGDKIVLVFNAPVPGTGNLTITTNNAGDLTAVEKENDETRTVFEISALNEDVSDNTVLAFGDIDDIALKGSFGLSDEFKAVDALATDVDGTALKTNDIIYITFNRPAKVNDVVTLGDEYGVGATYEWKEAYTVLAIKLGTEASITTGANKINVTALDVDDEFGKVKATGTIDLDGGFGHAIKPEIARVSAVSVTGQPKASQGDKIVVAFNTIIDHSDVTDISVTGGNLGNGFTIEWKDDKTTVAIITIGAGEPKVDVGTTSIRFVGDIWDITRTVKMSEADQTVAHGAWGVTITPELMSATIVKVSNKPTAQAGDKLVFVFTTSTNSPADVMGSFSSKLGTGATGEWSANGTIYTVTLGNEPTITDADVINFENDNDAIKDIYDFKAVPDKAGLTLKGSFGKANQPELISATIVKTKTDVGAQQGDQIVLVFSAMTNGIDNTPNIIGSLGSKLGTGATGVWSSNGTVYTVNLGENPTITEADDISLTENSAFKDVHNIVMVKGGTVDLVGSFGTTPEETPQIVSAVAFSKGNYDYIKVTFNIDTNLNEIASHINFKNKLKENNPELGYVGAIETTDNTMIIELGVDATVRATNQEDADATNDKLINLAELGIASKSSATPLAVTNAPYTGYTAPVLKDVVAENGGKIRITFTTRTNEASINLDSSAALYGEGATASWDDAKTLVITLGTDYGITERGYISLDNLRIKDGYSGSYVVSGQYKIQSGSFTSDALKAMSAVAKSPSTAVTTAASGDKITIVFSYATDRNDNLANIISEVKSGDAVVANPFGTGATCTWITGQKLVITLGDAPEIKRDDVIYFNKANIKTLSGQELTTESIALKGSFDGRNYFLSGNYVAQTATAKDHSFKVVVDNTSDAVAAKPTIVCVAYNGNTPVAISRVSAGIDETAEFVFTFSGSYTITNAKVYAFKGLFDDITDTTASPEVLAETKTINK